MQISRYSMPPNEEATNRLMSELALQSAIEIEEFSNNEETSLHSLRELAAVLNENKIDDLTLLPVYDRALTSNGSLIRSKQEMHKRLFDLSKKLENVSQDSAEDLNLLKDFCLSLHEALLNSRIETLYKSASPR